MTFAELAAYVATNLEVDGDSVPPIPASSPYFSSAWGTRLAIYLRRFTRDTLLLHSHMSAVTVDADVQTLDLSDSAVSSLDFFDVHRMWLNNSEIEKWSGADTILRNIQPNDASGTPTAFAQLDSQKIIFNCKTSDTIDDCYAQGFYRHPAITDDSDSIVGVIEDYLDLFSRYAQALFREDAVVDDVGMARLQRIDRQAYEAVQSLRGERMYNLLPVRGC